MSQYELKQKPKNWTISGKKNTKTTFVVGVTMATNDIAEERNILMDVKRRSQFSIN